MKIDLSQYTGTCECGKQHNLLTKKIIIEDGAAGLMGGIADTLGLSGKGCLVCDENTRPYAQSVRQSMGERLHSRAPMAVLDPQGLHADEKAVAMLQEALPSDAAWLVAVGSGTIHDATRYVANDRGIGFLSFPTAASVDGFVSTVSAMTWYGYKKTLPGVAPVAVVADTAIFSRAPYRLTASGIGDVLGKYTSLLDWRVSHMLAGEGYCGRIASLTAEAVDNVMMNLDGIAAGDPAGCEKLMFALLLSGVAMQMWGNSRPASGAEHHLSHLWEMEVINPHLDAYHGEKVGVGLLLVMREYEKFAALAPEMATLADYAGMPTKLLKDVFGGLYPAMEEENDPDILLEVRPQALAGCVDELRRLVRSLPSSAALEERMRAAGCMTTMEELGLSPELAEKSVELAPFVRRRLTLLRALKLLGK